MELNISIQFAKIGIKTYAGGVLIKNRHANFNLKQIPARQHISIPPVLIEIDMNKTFDDLGLKDPDTFKTEISMRNQSKALQNIARLSKYGDELAKIEKYGTEIIPKLALERLKGEPAEVNVECVPQHSPEMYLTGGGAEIQTELGGIELKAKPNNPLIRIRTANVKVYLRQKWDIKISVISRSSTNRVDLKV
ncbi:MAG: hypothetical protein HPY70_01955 [Firmicutes bacterium]|nr:hypothetical protein [Bacillota bacterium]